jgi:hypothetical protein
MIGVPSRDSQKPSSAGAINAKVPDFGKVTKPV